MNILQRLHEINELPVLPEIMFKVQALVSSDEGNAASLARIIEQDPSLTTKILKVANSSYFGSAAHRISSLPLAIARIGFNEVRNIVTAITLIKHFIKNSNVLDYKVFWRHCLTAAYCTQNIMESSPSSAAPAERQLCFLSGLLHDIGILIYDQFFHGEFEAIVRYALDHEKAFLAAEQAVAGKEPHAVLGAAILELWKLDPYVISGVRFHHQGLEKAPRLHGNVIGATYAAEYILSNCALGSFEGTIQDCDKRVLDSFGMAADSLQTFCDAAESQVEKSDLIVMMSMDSDKPALRNI
jgi:HD-like signal output (HDOD) protein